MGENREIRIVGRGSNTSKWVISAVVGKDWRAWSAQCRRRGVGAGDVVVIREYVRGGRRY